MNANAIRMRSCACATHSGVHIHLAHTHIYRLVVSCREPLAGRINILVFWSHWMTVCKAHRQLNVSMCEAVCVYVCVRENVFA